MHSFLHASLLCDAHRHRLLRLASVSFFHVIEMKRADIVESEVEREI